MKAKKLGLAIGSVALVGAMAVGGSLAYLSATSNTATNVFTGDNNDLGGKIVEDFDHESASSYLPGDVITKEPTFTNDSDSIDAYVAVKVEYLVDGEKVSYADFAKKYATIDFNTADWTSIAENSDSSIYMYNTVLASGKTSSKVFSEVSVLTGIETVKDKTTKTTYTYKELDKDGKDADGNKCDVAFIDKDGKLYALVSTESATTETEKTNGVLPSLQIVVSGYMVQAKNNTADGAKAALLKLAE